MFTIVIYKETVVVDWKCNPIFDLKFIHFLFYIFDRLSTEVLSLVPSVSEVTSLFYEPDYPPDFTRTLPPLIEADDTEPSSAQTLVDHTKGILKTDN